MEKIMVIAFENEANAHHGIRALRKLDSEGSITDVAKISLPKAKA